MIEQKFPPGWDEERIKRLLAEMDSRSEDEWVAADEAASAEQDDQTIAFRWSFSPQPPPPAS